MSTSHGSQKKKQRGERREEEKMNEKVCVCLVAFAMHARFSLSLRPKREEGGKGRRRRRECFGADQQQGDATEN